MPLGRILTVGRVRGEVDIVEWAAAEPVVLLPSDELPG